MVAIPVKLGYTVVGEACDEPTTERPAARPDGSGAVQSRAAGAGDERAGRGGGPGPGAPGGGGGPGPGAPGGGRWLLVHRGGAARRAPLGRRGRRAGGPVQSGGAGGGR